MHAATPTVPRSMPVPLLLVLFGLAMTLSQGIKSPLDYSVFSAAACALLLALQVESTTSAAEAAR